MTTQTNRQFLLAKRPVGAATRETFTYQEVPVGEPAAGQILVKNEYLSLDPAMRGWMNEGKSYIPPVGIGEVMRALGVGKVVASNNPGFAVGDYVNGALGVQDFSSASHAVSTRSIRTWHRCRATCPPWA